MNKKFLLITILFSSTLFACPNLEDIYPSCADDSMKNGKGEIMGGAVHNLTIIQDKAGNKDRYTFEYKDGSDEVSRPYGSAIVGETVVTTRLDRWSRINIKQEVTAKCDEKNSLILTSKIYHDQKLFSDTHESLVKNKDNMVHSINGVTDGKKFSVVMDCRNFVR